MARVGCLGRITGQSHGVARVWIMERVSEIRDPRVSHEECVWYL